MKEEINLRLVAFSDWRVNSISELIKFIKSIKPRPDLILYGGDDNERFESLPAAYLKKSPSKRLVYGTYGQWFDSKGIGDLFVRTGISISNFKDKKHENNYFLELSKLAKYGLCYVLGNDSSAVHKLINLKHSTVFDVHEKPLQTDNFVVMGQEGATFENEEKKEGIGYILYKEKSIREHLQKQAKFAKNRKIILVSHCPPYNVLDSAIRFGERNIGSLALHEFIQKKQPILVICGHVHSQGGNTEKIGSTLVINAASHDDQLARGNVAIIDIKDSGIEVKWHQIPSQFELAYQKSKNMKTFAKRLHKLEFLRYQGEELCLTEAVNKYGKEFVEAFPDLYWSIKMSYRYSVKHIIELYGMGIRNSKEIKEEHVKVLLGNMKNSMFKTIVWQGWMRETAKVMNKPYIDQNANISWAKHPKIAYFDTEYVNANNVVIYGFLIKDKIFQFNMTQTEEVKELVNKLLMDGYRIFHYAGQDKQIVLNLFDHGSQKKLKEAFVNVFYMIQQQIGLPVKSLNLHVVSTYLKDGKEVSPDNDGFFKAMMCNEVLNMYYAKKNFKSTKCYKDLLKTNEEDCIALKLLVDGFNKLEGNIDKNQMKLPS